MLFRRPISLRGLSLSGGLRRWTTYLDILLVNRAQPWWWRLEALNRLGFLLAGSLMLALIVWVTHPIRATLSKDDLPLLHSAMKQAREEPSFDTSRLDRLRSSSIFGAHSVSVNSRPERANSTLAELSANLLLQGVLGGETPRAIVLYIPTQQVHCLAPGQFIGQIELVEVRPTSILLAWNKEKIELTL